jgi:prostaglandin-endoperoxide synthase 2
MTGLRGLAVKYLLPVLTHIAPRWTEKLKVNIAVGAEKGRRPHPFSLWTGMAMGPPAEGRTAPAAKPLPAHAPAAVGGMHPTATPFSASTYVSWPSLADRRYTGRHLPPAAESALGDMPPMADVVQTLYLRRPGEFTPCKRTSVLFCFFAQWFTDSFLRTDPLDRRRTTSNHEIDYCQIYGLDERTAFCLRERVGGRMRLENGMLPRLVTANGLVRPEFSDISYIRNDTPDPDNDPPGSRLRKALGRSLPQAAEPQRWNYMYAAGLERGNSTILYTAFSTMAVREHNRVAGTLQKRHPDWDDDRLFETGRIIMIRNVLQLVVEDYINHLAGSFNFKLDRHFAEQQSWYRSNRISLEFNLLYRWHSLVPETFRIDGQVYEHSDYRFNNAVLEAHGVEHCINAASTQSAGRVQLYNTPRFLEKAEMASLDMARTFRLQPFVAYCERFSRKPPETIAELVNGDPRATADLTRLYGTVDRVELPVGLLAQARDKGEEDAVLPPLVRTMVAVDAFTHIFTNPLLAEKVHEAAFEGTAQGVGDLTEDTQGIVGLMRRSSLAGAVAQPSFSVRSPMPGD